MFCFGFEKNSKNAKKCVSSFAFCRCNPEGEVYGGAVTLWWGRCEGALMKAVQGHYGINNHFSQQTFKKTFKKGHYGINNYFSQQTRKKNFQKRSLWNKQPL